MTGSLGSLTAAAVREQENTIHLIAQVTGLSERSIRGRLASVHGKTLVCNVFKDHWPATASMLAEVNARLARECALFDEIATVTGLSEWIVRSRIQEAHGGRILRRIFEREWPKEGNAEAHKTFQDAPDTNDAHDEAQGSDTGEFGLDAESIAKILQVSAEWSRPRRIDRVLMLVGMKVPQRLRTARFQELVGLLQRNGVEMQLADRSELKSGENASPGIQARVRLRRRSGTVTRARVAVHLSSESPVSLVASLPTMGASTDSDAKQETVDIIQSVTKVGLAVSRSDRVTHPLEVEKIRARAQRYSAKLASTTSERLLSMIDIEDSRSDVEEATRKITAHLDIAGRSDVFEHLFEIAVADGVVVAEEIEFLRWLEYTLAPKPGMLEELLHRYNTAQSQSEASKSDTVERRHLWPSRLSSVTVSNGGQRQNSNIATSVDEIMALLFSRK